MEFPCLESGMASLALSPSSQNTGQQLDASVPNGATSSGIGEDQMNSILENFKETVMENRISCLDVQDVVHNYGRPAMYKLLDIEASRTTKGIYFEPQRIWFRFET